MFRKLVTGAAILLTARLACGAQFPITACGNITIRGSYVLANNLSAAGNCLVIQTSRVTVDLSGFSITGNGTGAGITDGGVQSSRIVIRNGTILRFASGIELGHSPITTIERLTVTDNTAGIHTSYYAAVRDCSVSRNVDHAIVVGVGSIVSDNLVSNNGTGTSGANIVVSTSSGNGIATSDSCLIGGNNASGNTHGLGISGGNSSLVIDNVASADSSGISVLNASALINNTAAQDPGFGMGAGPGSTVAQNTASMDGLALNTDGIRVQQWSLITGNSASSNAHGFTIFCPSNVVGNTAKSNTLQNYFYFTPPSCGLYNNL